LAGLAALVGAGTAGAVVVFGVSSVLALGALRPVARRHRNMPPAIRTGAAALVGKPALVLERIANQEGVGCVKIDGEVWTARSYDEDDVIDTGERVEVVEIRGATALVVR
jgi:membrane protein implicated in regulation of membrane protease activity